jgi:hypothetical protein
MMRRSRRLRAFATVATLVFFASAGARAAPNDNGSAVRWGWTTVILSVALGASVTSMSMAIECPRNDLGCARWTSLGIWGGIGIASAGTVVGLLVIRAASPPARVRVSFTVGRSQPGSPMPHATLVYSF